jgi:two-component system osmolarity sensor histidine kinase EnvZ
MLIRLLRSSVGPRVAQIGQSESGFHRVAKAVSWLRANFAQPMTVEALADLAHMNRLIAGYLELARTTQAEVRVRFDLSGLLDEVAAAAGLVWPGAPPCEIVGGRLAVRQIVTNLIQNAQRYGGTRIELELECGIPLVRVIVRDTGAGIPEDQLEKVFRPFYRLEASRSQATGGMGLGLAIVRQLAETNGWKVALQNRPQGGLEAVLEIRR